jgi:nitroreductase
LSGRGRHRPDHRRAAVANEAARLIQEQGMTDFRAAKAKAVERLGLRAAAPLPTNAEIDLALAERNRIFRGDDHRRHVRELREAALAVMHSLAAFHARLVGAVLSGNATPHSAIELHVFSDAPEAVAAHLDAIGIRHRATQFRHQFRLRQAEQFPGFRFVADEFEYAATVFTEKQRRRAPLSPIDGRPMRRGSIADVESLLRT